MRNARFKGLLTAAVVFIMMFACTVIGYAASGSVTFGSSSYSVEAGKEFNIGVYVKSDVKVGAYTFSITYDSDKIEYVSGADAAGEGILSFAGYPNNTNTKIWLTFKAKEAGTCTIAVTSPYIGPTDSSYGDSLTISKAASAPITIKGTSQTGGNTKASANLKKLWIEETGLYGFKADKTEYDITVGNELEKVTITAEAEDSNATVSISDTNLKVGANYIKVTVTATDGTTKKYTVIVRRKKAATATTTPSETTTPSQTTTPSETTTPAEPIIPSDVDTSKSLFSYNDRPLYMCKGFEGINIPKGYTETGIKINGDYQANALVNANGSKILLHLTEAADMPGRLYVYSVTKGIIYPYLELTNSTGVYVFDGGADPTGIPAGYEKVVTELNTGTGTALVTAWYNIEASDFYLVYASYNGGASELYQYDDKEGTIQRYNSFTPDVSVGTDTPVNNEEVDKLKAEIEELKGQNKSEMKIWLVVVIILAIVCVLLLAGIFFMFNKMREQQEYADYDEEDAEYYDDAEQYDAEGISDNRSAFYDGNEAKQDMKLDADENDDDDIDDNDFTFL